MVLPPQVIGCKLDGIKIPGCGKRSNFRPWPKDATDFIKQINQTQVTFFITTILKVPKARLASFAVIMLVSSNYSSKCYCTCFVFGLVLLLFWFVLL